MSIEPKTAGWDWKAFLLGPFWFFSKGMNVKGSWLLFFSLATGLLAVPFILVYCGARGYGDWYDFRLKQKSRVDLNSL